MSASRALSPRAQASLTLAVLAVALAALGLHARAYLPFLCDDALISLRYAKRLLQGDGLTWNPGERVEGYSNLLWVLSTAALGGLGVDLITAVRVLGVLGMAAAVVAVLHACRPTSPAAAWLVLMTLLFLSLSGPVAVWAIGGMEQPLVAGLLAWAIALSYPWLDARRPSFRQVQGAALCFGLLCLTRPDGPLFTAAAIAAILLIGRFTGDAVRTGAYLGALPLVLSGLQLAFRLHYYGEWVPNTALVKVSPSIKYALDGARYVGHGVVAMWPLVALAAASATVSLRTGFLAARTVLLSVLAVAWAGYLIVIGGDIFPAWRHFVPLLVLLTLMVAGGVQWVIRQGRPRLEAGAGVLMAVLLGAFWMVGSRDPVNADAMAERWEWDGQVIGTLLRETFGPQKPLLAVDAAGALPYWSELPAVDMLGLNDHYLPRHPPKDRQTIGIGHDLGDGRYVLGRAPDLVVFGIATGGEHGFFRSAREMQHDPEFWRDYTLVDFEGTEPYVARARIWVRKNGGRIGIRRSPEQIVIPGFVLSGGPGSVARRGRSGSMTLALSPGHPARIDGLDMPEGRWRIEARASGGPLRVRVSATGTPQRASTTSLNAPILEAPLPATFDLPDGAGGRLSIELSPGGDAPVELDEVVLTRRPPQ